MTLTYAAGIRALYWALNLLLDAEVLSAIKATVILQMTRTATGEEKHAAAKGIAEKVLERAGKSAVSGTLLDIAIKVIVLFVRGRL